MDIHYYHRYVPIDPPLYLEPSLNFIEMLPKKSFEEEEETKVDCSQGRLEEEVNMLATKFDVEGKGEPGQ